MRAVDHFDEFPVAQASPRVSEVRAGADHRLDATSDARRRERWKDEWKQFLKATWDALVLDGRWTEICRKVVGGSAAPTQKYSQRELDYSRAWCHRIRRNYGSVGIYLEPTHFTQLNDRGHVVRDGAAVDIAVRLQTPGQAASYADAFLELLDQIDPGLNVRRAVYPNLEADEHPNNTVVVCVPPGVAVPALHRNWDSNGLWISLRCQMGDLNDHDLGRVADVVQRLSNKLDHFGQVVKLALAYLAAGPVRPFSFESLLGWCGEYVVDRHVEGVRRFQWVGGFSPCDFMPETGNAQCVEVKTTTRGSQHHPWFSINEIRYGISHANDYHVARATIDANPVWELHELLRGMTPAVPGMDTPLWSKQLAGVIGFFVPANDQLRNLLERIERASSIDWYSNPFVGPGGTGLGVALDGGDAVLGEGDVEVILRPEFATKSPVFQS